MAKEERRTAHEPDWQVIGVLAEDDGLPEFSYTVGLHERGLPELFCWASPSDGTDPGEDWFLRHLERGHLMNRWARMLIEGRIGPGTTWSEDMDFGLTTATFTCGELVEPPDVEANMAHPRARVMPIRFAIERDVLRAPGEVDCQAAAAITRWTVDVTEALSARGARAPAQLADPPFDLSIGQAFGPATALVEALRAAVRDSHPDQLSHLNLLSLSMDMEDLIRPEVALGGTRAHARAVGLDAACDAAEAAAQRDVRHLAQRTAVRRELARFMGASPQTAAGRDAIRMLSRQLGNALGAAYTAAVTVDVLPSDLRRAALGPCLTALTDAGVRGLWFGHQERRRVRKPLADLSLATVAAISRGFENDEGGDPSVVHVHALMGAGESPPAAVLLAGTSTLDRVRAETAGRPEVERNTLRRLTELANALSVADLPQARPMIALLDC